MPSGRYKDTNLFVNSTTKLRPKEFIRYGTTIYDNVEEKDTDIFVITQEGDRLDNLAFQFYGNPHLWWYIAQANNLNTMNVEAGIQMRIPMSKESANWR